MIVTHVLSSFGMGGQERVVVELARAQVAAGHRVLAISLAHPPEGPHAQNLRAAGATVHTLEKRGTGFDVSLVVRLARFFRQYAVDVVHTHNPQPLMYAALAAKIAGASLVHTKHGANPDRMRRRILRRAAAAFADAYVAVSAATADVAREKRECAAGRLQVIPNGVDIELFAPNEEHRRDVRRGLAIPERAFVIGTVGRLAPEKDQALLLRAAAPLLGEDVRLVLVGDGPEAGGLKDLATKLGKEPFVRFAGARGDGHRFYSAFDVFCLSSKTEGLPLVIPEAMAAGLPVVSTDVGGIGSVIEEGRTGRLIPAGDEQALRAALEQLIENRALARRLGQTAQSVARLRYSRQRMATEYSKLYEKVTHKRLLPKLKRLLTLPPLLTPERR
jgi:glycosyltransferase involved in cell wall biosynthesis